MTALTKPLGEAAEALRHVFPSQSPTATPALTRLYPSSIPSFFFRSARSALPAASSRPPASPQPLRVPTSLSLGAVSPARSLSPTWRANAPTQGLYVADFFALLQAGDEGGVAELLRRAPGLANAARDGLTPLHAAVRAKSLPLVQLLVRGGADARAVDREGRTAAQAAAADGAAGMAAWLEKATR